MHRSGAGGRLTMDTPVMDTPVMDGSASLGRKSAVWRSTKTYGHEEGLSCCFRQWRATHSHCRLLHGYALSFRLTFASGVTC